MCCGPPALPSRLPARAGTAMEGLERLRAKFTVDLHPSKLASAQEGVRAHLSSLLLR